MNDTDIIRIGKRLRDRSLPKAEWTHAAHVAAAVYVLDRHGARAEAVMPELIRRYNAATGTPNTDSEGYHHTITLASLRRIRAEARGGTLSERFARAMAAGLDRADWLLAHYTRERLFSVAARREWVEPDLSPLP